MNDPSGATSVTAPVDNPVPKAPIYAAIACAHDLGSYPRDWRRGVCGAKPLGIGHCDAGKTLFSPCITMPNAQYPMPIGLTLATISRFRRQKAQHRLASD